MADLKGKKIIVTGISSGIGKATAVEVAKSGAQLSGFDINQEEGSKVVENIVKNGGNAKFFKVNTSVESQVKEAVNLSNQWMGGVDVLLQIAGIMGGAMVDIRDLEEEVWDNVIDVNLKGSFLMTKHVSKIMIPNKKGVIVLTGSGAGTTGGSASYAYGSSKGGTHGLAMVLDYHVSRHGIRINDVLPGRVRTGITTKGAKPEDIKLLVEPSKVAEVYAFLASDSADYVRGTIITK